MKPIFTSIQIRELFPFHVLVNRNLEILQTGKLINRLLSTDLEDEPLLEHFTVDGITDELTFDTFLKSCNKLIYLESIKDNIVLKGAFYETADSEQLIFIGNIQPDHLLKHYKNKITLKDIPVYDSFNDFLFSHRANTKAFEELQLLLEKSTHEARMIKSLTKDIRESEGRYHDFIEHSQEGIWKMEFLPPLVIKTPGGKLAKQLLYDGKIVECNDAMAKMYGYKKAEEFYGRRLIDLFTPETKEEEYTAIKRAKVFIKNNFRVDESISREMDKDNNVIYISNNTRGVIENGLLLRLWGVQRYVTEKVFADEKMRESEEKFRQLADTALDALITIDEEQQIVMINPAAERMFGYKAAKIKGKGLEVLIPNKYKKGHGELVKGFEKLQKQNKRMKKFGLVHGLRADGTEFPIETSLSKMKISGKIYFNAFVRDVSERVENERELSNQLKRLKKYAFVTSHDLRRPIATIQGLVGVFNHEQPDDPFNQEILRQFKTVVDEMDDVTRQTMDILVEDELLDD